MSDKISRESEVSELNLSVRAFNCLMRANVRTVGDLLDNYANGGRNWLENLRHMGPRSADEVEQAIKKLDNTDTEKERRSRTAESLRNILKALSTSGFDTVTDTVLCSAIEAASREAILPCEPHYDYEA